MHVNLFVPCYVDQVYPNVAKASKLVLEKHGVTVSVPRKQTCCGQPLYNSGEAKKTGGFAKDFLKRFKESLPIVVPSASCAAFVKEYYKELFANDTKRLKQAQEVSDRIWEIGDFLVNQLKVKKVEASFPYRVTFHDSCHAMRHYGLTHEARTLLQSVNGLELIEMKDRETCCGFGGTFLIKYPEISTAMVEQKLEYAQQTNAEYLVGTESSCLLNMDSYVQKNGMPLKVVHYIEILAGTV